MVVLGDFVMMLEIFNAIYHTENFEDFSSYNYFPLSYI